MPARIALCGAGEMTPKCLRVLASPRDIVDIRTFRQTVKQSADGAQACERLVPMLRGDF